MPFISEYIVIFGKERPAGPRNSVASLQELIIEEKEAELEKLRKELKGKELKAKG